MREHHGAGGYAAAARLGPGSLFDAAVTLLVLGLAASLASAGTGAGTDYPIRPVPFSSVKIADGFWSPRLDTNRTVTLRHNFDKCERTVTLDFRVP